MSVVNLQVVDPYKEQREFAKNQNRDEFEKWRQRVGDILEFTFCNSKAISVTNDNTKKSGVVLFDNGVREQGRGKEKTTIQLPPTQIQVTEVCEDTMSIVFTIIAVADQEIFEKYLKDRNYRIPYCITFYQSEIPYQQDGVQKYHQNHGVQEHFLCDWFKKTSA